MTFWLHPNAFLHTADQILAWMTTDARSVVRNCILRAKRVHLRKKMSFVPRIKLQTFMTTKVRNLLSERHCSFQNTISIPVWVTILIIVFLLKRIYLIDVVQAFLNYCICMNGPPKTSLPDNETYFITKFFSTIYQLFESSSVAISTANFNISRLVVTYNWTVTTTL